LTQEQLAERAGLSQRSISDMERGGKHIPRRDTVTLLVRALGLSRPEREVFEGLVERSRRRRPMPNRRAIYQAPLITERVFIRPKHHLPRSVTSLVGREQELAELDRLLATADPSLVPSAVVAALGLNDIDARNVTSTVAEYLMPLKPLLVLHNCEHLVEACAKLVASLLRTCPHVQFVATGRAPLALAGEVT
jgi:transcriptional regulator with XRE-family HTH domain